jgi:hypothetical protein
MLNLNQANFAAPETGIIKTVIPSHFILSHKCENGFFAAYRTDDRRSFDGELIIFYFYEALLICSSPRLIPRDFNFVSNFVTFKTVLACVRDHRSIKLIRFSIGCFRAGWSLSFRIDDKH